MKEEIIERREDKYISLLKEGYITKEEFMRLMEQLNTSAQTVPKQPKKQRKQFTFSFPSVLKKAVPVVVVVLLLFSVLTFITPVSRAASPVVAYSSISDGEQFVDVIPGEGVYLTVNVSDSDGNLQSVDIYTNASGSWSSIYSSGALGGVSYHNTSSFLVSSWLGSWTRYWFNITANDGSDTEFVYSFTTEYVFGLPQMSTFSEQNLYGPRVIKTGNDEYFTSYMDESDNYDTHGLEHIHSTGWALDTTDESSDCNNDNVGLGTWNCQLLEYANEIYQWSSSASGGNSLYYKIWKYNFTDNTWSLVRTASEIYSGNYYNTARTSAPGVTIDYYNGKYYMLVSNNVYCGSSSQDKGYTDLIFGSCEGGSWIFSKIGSDIISSSGCYQNYYWQTSCVYNSYLYYFYIDREGELTFSYFDGVSFNVVLADYEDLTDVRKDVHGGMCAITDLTNNQVVLVYVDKNDDLVYRVTDNITGLSAKHLILDGDEYGDFYGIDGHYIDSRITVWFSSNYDKSVYNIYSISAPDYVSTETGLESHNRIQFPDAQPQETNVFSEVVGFKNINNRDILNVTWHFEDIGDISLANNVRVWSNMSGSWQSWSVGSDGNTSKIDISTVKGSEWQPGETLYWKFEILNVGSVAETLHATDEDIYMLIEF